MTLLTFATYWVLALSTSAAVSAEKASTKVIQLETRSGVTVETLIVAPRNPVAVLIMLEGGGGEIGLSGTTSQHRGFLSSSRERYAAHGLIVALVDAPSDMKGKRGNKKRSGMSGLFRTGRNHLTDIRIIAAWLEKEYGVPVWLVGSSRGTQSAASIAIKSNQPFAGLVLISSMAHVPDTSEPVPSMALDRITIPTLILAHRRDGCSYTPASGAALIADKLKNVSRWQVRIFEGGKNTGEDPCKPHTHHTLYGLEKQVVGEIAGFIAANPAEVVRPTSPTNHADRLTREEIEQLLVGNTVAFTNSRGQSMLIHFDDGGRYTVVRKANPSRKIHRKWWFNNDSLFCRTIGRKQVEQCAMIGEGEDAGSVIFYGSSGRRLFHARVLEGQQLPD